MQGVLTAYPRLSWTGAVGMFLRDYEQRLAPLLSSELGEPILRCIALNAATMHDRMDYDSFTPLWRPSLMVDGQPTTRLPQTMFLILTPTRILITDTTPPQTKLFLTSKSGAVKPF